MSLLTASNLSKSFGQNDIFSGVEISIPQQARIAIVGPNGVGKTTLIRVLVGLEEASTGTIHKRRGLQIGYLPQEAALTSTEDLWTVCLEALGDLLEIEAELARLEHEMGGSEAALERYARLQPVFEQRGGYTYETRIRQTLSGLGFDQDDYHRPVRQLSGGQRTRAALARLLIAQPDLLVLDEPTNHLDMAAVEWLESYLAQWRGAALIVSHDRYFLDQVVDHIWEMSRTGIELYRGSYTAYTRQRQERWDLRMQLFESEQARLLKEVEYIKRNISGQNTIQAKGRLRRLSREVQAIEAVGVEAYKHTSWAETSSQVEISEHSLSAAEAERRVRGLRPPENRPPHLHINLKAAGRSGELVIRTRDLAVGYADENAPLFTAPDLLLKRGDCAALIGPNGAGKTTFLKTILGLHPPFAGEVILGASLEIAYFAQAHEGLDPARSLAEEIASAAPNLLAGEIRNYLARFLFTGDDVYKRVATLSGGERGRLALAKLSLLDANLLLLDEPTNHLDIPSQEILQEVLADYPGTILLVSHDRYLIDALATQVWEIDPLQTTLQVFAGTYSEWRAELARRSAAPEPAAQTAIRAAKAQPPRPSPAERQRNNRLKELEGTIGDLENRLEALSAQLEIPPNDPLAVQQLGNEYVEIQNRLEELMQEWEVLQV